MADQTINNMSVTWNSGGTTFSFMKVNVTDTASAAASLLQNFQVGGVAKWTVRKDGTFTAAGNGSIAGTLAVTGTFTGAAINGTSSVLTGDITLGTGTGAGTVKHPTDTGSTVLAGGSDGVNGAAITLYGDAHATQANDIVMTAVAGSLRYQWDNSIGDLISNGPAADCGRTSGGRPLPRVAILGAQMKRLT